MDQRDIIIAYSRKCIRETRCNAEKAIQNIELCIQEGVSSEDIAHHTLMTCISIEIERMHNAYNESTLNDTVLI